MDYETFVAAVQELSRTDREHAERAVQATLRTLAARLSRDEAQHLVELLPPEFGPLLFHVGPVEPLDVDAFLERVVSDEGTDVHAAQRDASIVLAVFDRAIGNREFDRIAATLPKDFAPLLPRGAAVGESPYEAIVTAVAQRAGLDRDRAQRAIEAVLRTLAEQIAPGEIDDLIARLPIELHPLLKDVRAHHRGSAAHVPLDEFLERVAQREGTDRLTSERDARAVFTSLREAIGDDEFFDVTVQLPFEYGALWVQQ
jgi:uncharacterized protein (DUF2267 family)